MKEERGKRKEERGEKRECVAFHASKK